MELLLVIFVWVAVTLTGSLILWWMERKKRGYSRVTEYLLGALAFGTLMFFIL